MDYSDTPNGRGWKDRLRERAVSQLSTQKNMLSSGLVLCRAALATFTSPDESMFFCVDNWDTARSRSRSFQPRPFGVSE